MKLRAVIPSILALSLPFFEPCVPSMKKGPPEPKQGEIIYEVVTTTPRLEDKPRMVISLGAFVASDNVVVRAESAGSIEKVSVSEGDEVRAGDALAVFRGDDLKAEMEKKRGELREAQAVLDHDRRMLELQNASPPKPAEESNNVFLDEENNNKDKVIPDKFTANPPSKPAEIEDWPSKIEVSQAKVDSLTKELELLDAKAQRLTVAAPIAGFVRKRSVGDNSFVEIGAPLMELVTINPIAFHFDVPSEVSSYVDKQVKLEASPTTAPDISSQGEIFYISPSIDPQRHALEVKARFPNENGLIKEGQQGRVTVTTRKTDKLTIIPKDALVREDNQDYIYVVTGPQVRKTLVKITESVGDKEVAVEANLRVDDPIVISGQANLRDYSFVKIIKETPPASPANTAKEQSLSPPLNPAAIHAMTRF